LKRAALIDNTPAPNGFAPFLFSNGIYPFKKGIMTGNFFWQRKLINTIINISLAICKKM
jgi:hypothetical protein